MKRHNSTAESTAMLNDDSPVPNLPAVQPNADKPERRASTRKRPGKTTLPGPALKQFDPAPADMDAVAARQRRRDERVKFPKVVIDQQNGGVVTTSLAPAAGDYLRNQQALEVGWARLSAATGITDMDALIMLLEQIVSLASRVENGKVDQNRVNGFLGMVAEIGPKDALEASLAIQIVATTQMAMRTGMSLMHAVKTIDQLNANSNHYNKLVRSNVAMVECLKRYRGNGEQKVTVTHNHVTVNAGQAAVAVNHPGGGGAVLEERRQPDVKATDPAALAYAPGAALPCEIEADKAGVPAARG